MDELEPLLLGFMIYFGDCYIQEKETSSLFGVQ